MSLLTHCIIFSNYQTFKLPILLSLNKMLIILKNQVRRSLPALGHFLIIFVKISTIKKEKMKRKQREKREVIFHKRRSFFSTKQNQQKKQINQKLLFEYRLPIYLWDSQMTPYSFKHMFVPSKPPHYHIEASLFRSNDK